MPVLLWTIATDLPRMQAREPHAECGVHMPQLSQVRLSPRAVHQHLRGKPRHSRRGGITDCSAKLLLRPALLEPPRQRTAVQGTAMQHQRRGRPNPIAGPCLSCSPTRGASGVPASPAHQGGVHDPVGMIRWHDGSLWNPREPPSRADVGSSASAFTSRRRTDAVPSRRLRIASAAAPASTASNV
jgi:hypothetical protein